MVNVNIGFVRLMPIYCYPSTRGRLERDNPSRITLYVIRLLISDSHAQQADITDRSYWRLPLFFVQYCDYTCTKQHCFTMRHVETDSSYKKDMSQVGEDFVHIFRHSF